MKYAKYAIGKTVASINTKPVRLTTSDRKTAKAITEIVFTDGSRLTFYATEVEYGDPIPLATYHGRPS